MPIYKTSSGWMYKCCINSHQYCKRGFNTKKEAELTEAAFKLNFKEDKTLNKINQKLVMSWYYNIDSLKVTISYKNHLLNSFKNFCKYLSLYYNLDFSIIEQLYTFSDYSIKTIDLEEDKKYLDLNEFKTLLNSIDDKYWRLYLCLSFFLGLRIGELKALRNDEYCINHKYKALIVYRQLVYAGKGKQVAAKTKSKKVAISSTTIRRKLESINTGLCSRLDPHKFRHSTATNLFENGALKEDIKNFLGHESSDTTMSIYIHKTKNEVDRINNVLEEIFNKIKE